MAGSYPARMAWLSMIKPDYLITVSYPLGDVTALICNLLRECGHEPLQFFWFRSAVKLFNSMLNTNSDTLRRVVQADLNLQPRSSACWTAQLLSAFQGLRGCEFYVRAVQTGHAITMQEFTADLKHRMRGVWRDAELVDPNMHNNKLATYHSWFAIPFSSNERMPRSRLMYHGISILICPNMLCAI